MSLILQGKRIFMVEDNVNNRSIMQTILEQNGAIVTFDRWGKDSINQLMKFSPVDLILMDLMLSHGNTGYDVFDQIRLESEFDDVPILAVSAHDPSLAIPQTQSKGFAGFIAKPIDFDKFPKQVAFVLQKQEIWDISS